MGLVVINDNVGTGKTVSILLWIIHQKLQNKLYKTKVFVSKNIIFQWEEDLLKFFKNLLCLLSISLYVRLFTR